MKKIGLVGGTGPESTLMYYKELNSRIDNLTNKSAMPDLVIESVNFRRVWNYVEAGQYDELSDYIAEKVNCLTKSGAKIISLTAATMHIVFDQITRQTGVTLVSIPKTVCDEVVSMGLKRVGLLGTMFTMEQDFMKKDLQEAGIQVFVPHKEDRELIAKRIYEELEMGIVKESTLKEFVCIIEQLKRDDGIEAIILGCTELPLLLNADNCPICCIDAVDVHLKKLIELAI